MKGTEDDTDKEKDILCPWTQKINIFKTAILPTSINLC